MSDNKVPWPVWALVTLTVAVIGAYASMKRPQTEAPAAEQRTEQLEGELAPTPAPTGRAEVLPILDGATDKYAVRLSNCDDGGEAYVNGTLVGQIGFGDSSPPIDITDNLKPGANSIEFRVRNNGGTITYTFEILKNGETIFRPSCGFHHQEGCEGNRDYPVPIGITIPYTLTIPDRQGG